MRRERQGAVLDTEGPEAPEPGRVRPGLRPPRAPRWHPRALGEPLPSWGKGLCSVPFMTPRAAGPEKRLFLLGGDLHLRPVTPTVTVTGS